MLVRGGGGGVNLLAALPFCFFTKSGSSSFVRKCKKSWLAAQRVGELTFDPGQAFFI